MILCATFVGWFISSRDTPFLWRLATEITSSDTFSIGHRRERVGASRLLAGLVDEPPRTERCSAWWPSVSLSRSKKGSGSPFTLVRRSCACGGDFVRHPSGWRMKSSSTVHADISLRLLEPYSLCSRHRSSFLLAFLNRSQPTQFSGATKRD